MNDGKGPVVEVPLPGEPRRVALAVDGSGCVPLFREAEGLRVYDGWTGRLRWTQETGRITAAAFSSRGELATASQGQVRLWSADGTLLAEQQRNEYDGVGSLCFSPDGERLVVGGRTATVLAIGR